MTTEPLPTELEAQAVAEGGSYEVLRRRLSALAKGLEERAADLNTRRLAEFGDSKTTLLGRLRIMTDDNSVGRDIIQVGELLLFGFNVSRATGGAVNLGDVFGLYRLVQTGEGYEVEPVPLASSFLADPTFGRDFEELYAYYKNARLLQLTQRGDKLLMAFQMGERSSDMRVFRWAVSPRGEVRYLDARGSADLTYPPPFDFAWTRATREMEVSGRFPHLNILDTIFVGTGQGVLTVKTENNTETDKGIFAEPLDDNTQSLDDAQIEFARVGTLILLRVLPYREKHWRGLIYNTLTRRVTRMDAITQACIQLPEDHGLLFPGGYYLQGGDHRTFDAEMDGMQFERLQRSPNGEDVLYTFYEHEEGLSALFTYNLIARELQSPLFAHGHALLSDGRMVLFHDEGAEATRVHPMQVWQTPFVSDEYAASRPPSGTELGKLGNAALVRGISDLYQLARDIENPEVSAERYQALTAQTRKLFDAHHWFSGEVSPGLGDVLHEVSAAGENILDEFEKVQAMRAQAEAALNTARAEQKQLLGTLHPEDWDDIQPFVDALGAITAQRGKLLTIREQRYMDTAAIDALSTELGEAQTRIGTATGEFLAGPEALKPLSEEVKALSARADAAKSARELGEVLGDLGRVGAGLDTLSELLTRLPVDDATGRTRVLEGISGIYASLNALRAGADGRRKALGEEKPPRSSPRSLPSSRRALPVR
ncbi:DNA repair ATPase [Deinococcus lacus]|uniref:DNA repair ATPase n=1 Tax=Deinococcus lacus TaxID=392561 RepID=A0ABW1YF22_9DEIO